MADNEFIVTVKANTKPAEKQVEDFGDKFLSVGKAAATAFAGVFAASKVVGVFQDSVKEALEAEKAVKQFNFALKAAGVYSDEVSQGFQNYAASLQKVTGVQDEVILRGAQTLIQIGDLSGQMLNRTMMASLDFAAARGIDAAEAFEMLARAAQGNVTPFSKLGVSFREGASDAEKFNQVLGFIEGKFSGAAKESTKGFQGAINNLSNEWSDMLENFGKGTTESAIAIGSINALAESLKVLQVFASYVNGGLKNLADTAIYFSQVFVSVMNSISRGSFRGLSDDITKATDSWSRHIVENNNAIISYDSLNAKLTESTIPNINKLTEALYEAEYGIEVLREAQGLYEKDIEAIGPHMSNAADGFVNSMQYMGQSARQLGATVANTMKTGFGNAFAAMGSAIAKGEDAFGAFGKSILSMLGNIAIQMGQFYIAAGIAALWLNPAQGAGMIAGGAALSILGGVLQAMGGGGAAAAASAGGASAGAANAAVASGEDVIFNPTQEEERAKPETGVQVIVQGNILNTRESALEIAKALSDSFDTNGTIVRGFA